jgi:hypothetical protein
MFLYRQGLQNTWGHKTPGVRYRLAVPAIFHAKRKTPNVANVLAEGAVTAPVNPIKWAAAR